MKNYGSVSFQSSVSTYGSVTFQLSVKLQMEIYRSISEAGKFGHSMFLGKGNQITYLPMPRKCLGIHDLYSTQLYNFNQTLQINRVDNDICLECHLICRGLAPLIESIQLGVVHNAILHTYRKFLSSVHLCTKNILHQ